MDRWVEFFDRLAEHFPDANLELDYDGDPFVLLVAVVLSARTTDKAVNKVMPRLMADGATPEIILSLGEEEVAQRINTIGLYKNKAKFVIGICKKLIELGSVPNSLEELIKLPGVGRKTANIVLAAYFKQVTFPVDTHVFRVSNRTGLAPGKTPEAVERNLIKNVPHPYAATSHLLLIKHGRYVCKSQRPDCDNCPVSNLCDFGIARKQG